MSDVLKIQGLCASVEEKEILKGVDLEIKSGEVHAIMGPNGTGKSTLSSVIMGSPKYNVTAGSITLNDESILELAVDERARKGIFLAYQYPAEVPGVTNSDFIRTAMKATTGKNVSLFLRTTRKVFLLICSIFSKHSGSFSVSSSKTDLIFFKVR